MNMSHPLIDRQTDKVPSGNTFLEPMRWLQSSLHLLNDFCADHRTFSCHKLERLKLRGLHLTVDSENKELTIIVDNNQAYQVLQQTISPGSRLFQLLSLHFNRVHTAFRLKEACVEHTIILNTITLDKRMNDSRLDLRDENKLGTRFRRTVNAALQGHIGVLRLHDKDDAKRLRSLWERGRITRLIEKYGIIPFDDANDEIIKLWKPRRLPAGEEAIFIIE